MSNVVPSPMSAANGTWLVGSVTARYAELERAFGQPYVAGHGKSRVEWCLQTRYGVATIYDWKCPEIDLENLDHWNVGGTDDRVAEYLQSLLPGW
jgi:hypothetical protein